MWQYTGVDPLVAEKIFGSKQHPRLHAPQRVALAAALCPEILGEKKSWTANPKSIIDAERIGEECERSMRTIKYAVASWVESFSARGVGHIGYSSPGAALHSLLAWDRSLAVWVAASIAQRVAPFAHEEDTVSDGPRTATRWRVDDIVELAKKWSSTGATHMEFRDLLGMSQRFEAASNAASNIIYYVYRGAQRGDFASEDERVSMERNGLAMKVASQVINMMLTVDKKEKEKAAFDVASVSMELLSKNKQDMKSRVDVMLGLMSHAVIEYPAHYTGGSGAISAPSSVVPAALAGALLGAVGAHVAMKRQQ